MPKMRKGLGLREENFARMEKAVGPGVHKNSARPFGGDFESFPLLKTIVNIFRGEDANVRSRFGIFMATRRPKGHEREIS